VVILSSIRRRTYVGGVRNISGERQKKITGKWINSIIVLFNKEYFYQIEDEMARYVVRRWGNEYSHVISARKLKGKGLRGTFRLRCKNIKIYLGERGRDGVN